MADKTILKKNKNMVSRTIGKETVLLPVCKDTSQTNCIYTLNIAAAKIWELIDGKRSLDQIKKSIAGEFAVTLDQLDKQLSIFLKDLKEIRALD